MSALKDTFHLMSEKPIHAGDLAEYQGSAKALAGCRCVILNTPLRGKVAARTPSRVRVVVRLGDGRVVTRAVKSESLKRLGGGCLETKGRGMRDEHPSGICSAAG